MRHFDCQSGYFVALYYSHGAQVQVVPCIRDLIFSLFQCLFPRSLEATPSHDAMLEYGIECYRNLMILEAGLADKQFLVSSINSRLSSTSNVFLAVV